MNNDLKIILTVIITLTAMFTTSLLLDLEIVQAQLVRKTIIYIAILVQLYFGYMVFQAFKNKL